MNDTSLIIFVVGVMFSLRVIVVSECYILAIGKVERIIRHALKTNDPLSLPIGYGEYWTSRLSLHNSEWLRDLAAWNKWTPRQFFPSLYMWEA